MSTPAPRAPPPRTQAYNLHVALRCTAPVLLQAEFDCAAGELVALVGPSGSGKTTLLRAVAGLYRPPGLTGHITLRTAQSEHIWFDSQRSIALAPQARHVGLVFQQYALFPHLSAVNNIAVCAPKHWSQDQIQDQAMALLERLGLASLAHRLPHQLSGGQQQRVALARALVRIVPLPGHSAQAAGTAAGSGAGAAPLAPQAPGVLLLDEPFSAVDAPMRQVLYRALAQLHSSLHLPIVLVTHDLAEARRLADKVVIVDGGTTLQSGPPERVLRSPRNARVAQLVGIHNHFASQFYSATGADADAAAGNTNAGLSMGRLRWGQHDLHVQDKGKIDHATQVTWVLAGANVQVLSPEAAHPAPAAALASNAHHHGAPHHSAHQGSAPLDNYLPCQLVEMLPLGEICVCKLAVTGAPAGDEVTLNLSTALLRSMQAQVGCALVLHIPPEALHIMPVREILAAPSAVSTPL